MFTLFVFVIFDTSIFQKVIFSLQFLFSQYLNVLNILMSTIFFMCSIFECPPTFFTPPPFFCEFPIFHSYFLFSIFFTTIFFTPTFFYSTILYPNFDYLHITFVTFFYLRFFLFLILLRYVGCEAPNVAHTSRSRTSTVYFITRTTKFDEALNYSSSRWSSGTKYLC